MVPIKKPKKINFFITSGILHIVYFYMSNYINKHIKISIKILRNELKKRNQRETQEKHENIGIQVLEMGFRV